VLPVDVDAQPLLAPRRERSRNLAGGVLIFLGVVPMAGNLGWGPWLTWNFFWPVVLVGIGAMLLLRSSNESSSTA